MKKEIANLLEKIKADYNRFMPNNKQMQEEFADELCYQEGRKYVKVMTRHGGTVWGFIVNVHDDKKFQYGDILKPAGFNAPARNAARGNIFDDYVIRWTGPLYL